MVKVSQKLIQGLLITLIIVAIYGFIIKPFFDNSQYRECIASAEKGYKHQLSINAQNNNPITALASFESNKEFCFKTYKK